MSTNFYAYDALGVSSGVPIDHLVGVHILKRSNHIDFSIQAVVDSSWDRRFDFFTDCPYMDPCGIGSITSWAEWVSVLEAGQWVALDEYGTQYSAQEMVDMVSKANKFALEYDDHGAPICDEYGHYIDPEGYSMCWWIFS